MFFVSEKGGCWWRVGPPTLEPFALSHYSRNVSVCCKLSSVYLCSSTAPDSSVPLEVLEVRFVYHLLDPSEGGCISAFIWNSPLTWISFTCKEKKKKNRCFYKCAAELVPSSVNVFSTTWPIHHKEMQYLSKIYDAMYYCIVLFIFLAWDYELQDLFEWIS